MAAEWMTLCDSDSQRTVNRLLFIFYKTEIMEKEWRDKQPE